MTGAATESETAPGTDGLRVGVIGNPVAHSLSPSLHQPALDALASSGAVTQGLSAAGAVGSFVTGLVLMVVVLFFFLKDGRRIWQAFLDFVPRRHQARVDLVADQSFWTIGAYFRGQLLIAFVDALFIGIGLWILGVPLVLPLAVLVFLGGLIPIVGAVVSGAVAVVVALAALLPTTALWPDVISRGTGLMFTAIGSFAPVFAVMWMLVPHRSAKRLVKPDHPFLSTPFFYPVRPTFSSEDAHQRRRNERSPEVQRRSRRVTRGVAFASSTEMKPLAWIAVLALVLGTAWMLVGRVNDSQAQPQPSELRSVELYNACPQHVWIYYGRHAPLRPQDALVLGSGASSTSSMLEGDMVWLLDAAKEPVDNAAVGPETRRITVDETCGTVTPRSPDT